VIRPTQIKIHNYLLLSDVELNLGQGVYFVTGDNRDEQNQGSNGAGKSLFCSAFVWALFEDILRKDVSRDDIIGEFDDFTEVKLTFDVDGQEVVVRRVRNHPKEGNNVFLSVDGEDRTHATSKRETTKLIEEKLGLSKDVLYYCAYSDSDRKPLVALTSTELNKVVSEILNTARYDKWIKEVRSRRRGLESERRSDMKLLQARDEMIASAKKDIQNYKNQLETFEEEKAEKIEQLESDISDKRDERDEFTELLKKKPGVEKELKELEGEVGGLEDKSTAVKRLSRERDTQKKRRTSKQNKLAKIEAAMQSSKENLDNLTTNPTGECDVCGNLLGDSKKLEAKVDQHQKKVDAYQAKKVDVEVDISTLDSKISDLSDRIEELEAEVEAGRDKLTRYTKLENKLDKFVRAEKFVKNCDKRLSALMSRVERTEKKTPANIQASLTDKRASLSEAHGVRDDLKDSIEQAGTDIDACDALEGAMKKTKAARFNSFILNLQENINVCLDAMTDGDYHCQLREDGSELSLVFTNVSKKGKYFPYGIFSKGEKARISKAAATALNNMMDLGFIIDDEAVDGVDDAGIQRVLEFVLEQNEGKTLIFVGHQKAMSDYFHGHTNLHVIKENGESIIHENKNFRGQFQETA